MTIEPGDTADKEIERIARVLCKADGVDPNQRVVFTALAVSSRGFTFLPDYEGATGPAWQVYVSLARAVALDRSAKVEPPSPSPYRGTPAAWFAELVDLAYSLVMPRLLIGINEPRRKELTRKLRRHLACEPEEE
jgi:hypothetical protein